MCKHFLNQKRKENFIMEKVAMINELYFEEKKTLTEIAEVINTSVSYISKILRKNEKYNEEKEKRKNENLLKRRKIQKDLIYGKRKSNIDIEYIKLKTQHEQASMELSKRSILGKDTLRKWCSSAYVYNKNKKRYEFDTKNLNKPSDFPSYIKV